MQKANLIFVAVAVAVVAGSALVSAFPVQGYSAPYFFPGHCASLGAPAAGSANGTRLLAYQVLPGATAGSLLGAGLGGTIGASLSRSGAEEIGGAVVIMTALSACATAAGVYLGARLTWRS